jgi:hypothetical protein
MNSPFYKLTGDHNCEINGLKMSQSIIAASAWVMAVAHCHPRAVIEIGTGRGGLSSLLSHSTSLCGGTVVTVDTGHEIQYPLYGRHVVHQRTDCFDLAHHIAHRIKNSGLCFVLCDGGNKEREFNEFSKYLKPGDVIAAHDWINPFVKDFCPIYWSWSEVDHHNLDQAGMVEFMPELFDKSAWFVRQKV